MYFSVDINGFLPFFLTCLFIYLAVLGLCSTWDLYVAHSFCAQAAQLSLIGLIAPQHGGSSFPNQGSNLSPLHWEADS